MQQTVFFVFLFGREAKNEMSLINFHFLNKKNLQLLTVFYWATETAFKENKYSHDFMSLMETMQNKNEQFLIRADIQDQSAMNWFVDLNWYVFCRCPAKWTKGNILELQRHKPTCDTQAGEADSVVHQSTHTIHFNRNAVDLLIYATI